MIDFNARVLELREMLSHARDIEAAAGAAEAQARDLRKVANDVARQAYDFECLLLDEMRKRRFDAESGEYVEIDA